ncbi:hypothetical protein BH20ACT5_BH20ACT5_05590 [soil metagenome]
MNNKGKLVASMSEVEVPVVLALIALIVGWLALAQHAAPKGRPRPRSYTEQHTQNPEWRPGHIGQGGV